MNSKILLLGVALLAVVSCKENPQKKAEKNAEKYEKAAEKQADHAERNAESAIIETESAIGNTIMAGANEAMAQVDVPKFDNIMANKYVKEIGGDVVKYVNANDSNKAEHYDDLLGKHIDKVKNAVDKDLISEEDAEQIKTYAQKLAGSVGLTITAD